MVNGDAGMSLARLDHRDYADPGATGAKDLLAPCVCLFARVFRRERLPFESARSPLTHATLLTPPAHAPVDLDDRLASRRAHNRP